MKKMIGALIAVVALIAAMVGFAATATATGDGDGNNESTCEDQYITVIDAEAFDETIVDHEAYDETVVDSPAVPGFWANFQPNNQHETFAGPPSYPTDARGSWIQHDTGGPGQDQSGVYNIGNPHKGGNWFYRQQPVAEQTHVEHHDAVTHTVHHDAVTHREKNPAYPCPSEDPTPTQDPTPTVDPTPTQPPTTDTPLVPPAPVPPVVPQPPTDTPENPTEPSTPEQPEPPAAPEPPSVDPPATVTRTQMHYTCDLKWSVTQEKRDGRWVTIEKSTPEKIDGHCATSSTKSFNPPEEGM